MGFLCDREEYAKKPPWQGLARFQIVYIRKKFRLAKKSLLSTANGSGTEDTQHQDEQDSTVEDEVT